VVLLKKSICSVAAECSIPLDFPGSSISFVERFSNAGGGTLSAGLKLLRPCLQMKPAALAKSASCISVGNSQYIAIRRLRARARVAENAVRSPFCRTNSHQVFNKIR